MPRLQAVVQQFTVKNLQKLPFSRVKRKTNLLLLHDFDKSTNLRHARTHNASETTGAARFPACTTAHT